MRLCIIYFTIEIKCVIIAGLLAIIFLQTLHPILQLDQLQG